MLLGFHKARLLCACLVIAVVCSKSNALPSPSTNTITLNKTYSKNETKKINSPKIYFQKMNLKDVSSQKENVLNRMMMKRSREVTRAFNEFTSIKALEQQLTKYLKKKHFQNKSLERHVFRLTKLKNRKRLKIIKVK